MTSSDFIIRNERNVVDVVVSLEGEVKSLRREFEDFKQETREEFKNVRAEMQQEFKNVRQEMREGFQAIRAEMREGDLSLHAEIKQLTGEVRGLNRTVDTMITVFTWGFALVAIAVAIAPSLMKPHAD